MKRNRFFDLCALAVHLANNDHAIDIAASTNENRARAAPSGAEARLLAAGTASTFCEAARNTLPLPLFFDARAAGSE